MKAGDDCPLCAQKHGMTLMLNGRVLACFKCKYRWVGGE